MTHRKRRLYKRREEIIKEQTQEHFPKLQDIAVPTEYVLQELSTTIKVRPVTCVPTGFPHGAEHSPPRVPAVLVPQSFQVIFSIDSRALPHPASVPSWEWPEFMTSQQGTST